ncbi:tetratricopeptide repeat protein [Pontixanthobacter aquaemixtae]|uniref:hypothetical protein n=1 Tax=Pontixanthobacter aquaemixtae TaxID=1958940 RepID=UPI001926406E|nr:hypothetical protein [Pontixanthobacter aquaemixtae]
MIRIFAILIGLFFAMQGVAHAKWHKAESDHFVIYADDSEEDVRRFAEMLEQYHASMELVTGRKVDKPSPSNRVTIFAVGSQRDIRRLAGTDSRSLAGFYVPRAGGSKAFVQDIRLKNGYPDFSTVILLHEYAHHFLISTSRFAMPRWMSEGAAEFFAAASFNRDGSVQIGRPAQHRANELAYADEVSIYHLLDQELYNQERGKRYDAFYGRSWLLYHFLNFDGERKGQLPAYWQKVAGGAASIDAAREVFGDLDQLEKDLDRYLRQRRMLNYKIERELLSYGEVTVTRLSEGEAEMIPVRMRSQRGVDAETAAEVVVDARKIAEEFPDDPGVLTALAEAEYDAGNDEKAIAAATAAIARDPNRANAYVQHGYALFRRAEDADDQEAAYKAAMVPFLALNKIENDHPIPLIHFYRSYVQRGEEPNEQAKFALERAAVLAPFDQSRWFNVAMMQAGEGKIAIARQSLTPIANDPHGGSRSRAAKVLLTAMADAEEGKPFYVAQTLDTEDDQTGDQTGDSADDDTSEDETPESDHAPDGKDADAESETRLLLARFG